jgi:hypothetical protein
MWKNRVRRKKKIADRIVLSSKTNFKDLVAIVDLKPARKEGDETGFVHYCDPHSKPDFAKYINRRIKKCNLQRYLNNILIL